MTAETTTPTFAATARATPTTYAAAPTSTFPAASQTRETGAHAGRPTFAEATHSISETSGTEGTQKTKARVTFPVAGRARPARTATAAPEAAAPAPARAISRPPLQTPANRLPRPIAGLKTSKSRRNYEAPPRHGRPTATDTGPTTKTESSSEGCHGSRPVTVEPARSPSPAGGRPQTSTGARAPTFRRLTAAKSPATATHATAATKLAAPTTAISPATQPETTTTRRFEVIRHAETPAHAPPRPTAPTSST